MATYDGSSDDSSAGEDNCSYRGLKKEILELRKALASLSGKDSYVRFLITEEDYNKLKLSRIFSSLKTFTITDTYSDIVKDSYNDTFDIVEIHLSNDSKDDEYEKKIYPIIKNVAEDLYRGNTHELNHSDYKGYSSLW